MNRTNILNIIAAFLATSYVYAQQLDPKIDFAREVILSQEENGAEQWSGVGVGPTVGKPPGGYLFRFEYDITGDGREELFLGSSLDESEGTYSWTIYSPDAQQNYTKIASGVAILPVHGFYFKANGSQRELQTVYRNPKFGLGVIDKYAVDANGSVTHTTQELTPEQIGQLDADNWKETFGIGNEVKPTISKVLLAEYANNHAVQWRSYKTDLGVTEQNQDPADASAIAANSSFTLQTAKQLLGVP